MTPGKTGFRSRRPMIATNSNDGDETTEEL
jgi:hypothetical protein